MFLMLLRVQEFTSSPMERQPDQLVRVCKRVCEKGEKQGYQNMVECLSSSYECTYTKQSSPHRRLRILHWD